MSISSTRRRQSGMNPLVAILLILVGVVGVVSTLHFTGKFPIAAIDRLLGRNQVEAANSNMTAVTMAVRQLEPGHRVTRQDLWNPEKNFFQVMMVSNDQVNEEWLTKPGDIEGRVLARPKLPGRAFRETDFLPVGSSDGAVALVPEGMTLITLDASKIRGLGDLKFGDEFVLLVSEPVDPGLISRAEKILDERSGSDIARRLELASLKKEAYQRVIANKGKLIRPAQGGVGKREKDVAVAVLPEEVSPILAAQSAEHDIYCVARSGLAGAEEAKPLRIPDEVPPVERLDWLWESVKDVELINGNERATLTVPRATASAGR